MLQMQRAVRLPRCIFVSAAVQAKHAAIINLLKKATGSAKGGRWRWFADSAPQKSVLERCGGARQKAPERDGDARGAARAGHVRRMAKQKVERLVG